MEKLITGKAYVLGDNIDTDQIIPANFLSYNPSDPNERKYFGMYANSGVPEAQAGLPKGNIRFVPENEFKSEYSIIVGGKNFGCGSSREHAPLALAEAGDVGPQPGDARGGRWCLDDAEGGVQEWVHGREGTAAIVRCGPKPRRARLGRWTPPDSHRSRRSSPTARGPACAWP